MDTQQPDHRKTNQALARLAAGVAHEINNPLGALASATDTIERMIGRMEADSAPGAEAHALQDPMRVVRNAAQRIGEVVALLERLERLVDHHGDDHVQMVFGESAGRMRLLVVEMAHPEQPRLVQ